MSIGYIKSLIMMMILVSILILVHEAGHFFAAKFFKLNPTRFGFGLPFGPTLWEKEINGVKFLIHACLFGGYVSFADDEEENSDIPANSDQRISNRPVYQRAIIYSAGVVANFLCAIVMVLLAAAIWGQMPSGNYDVFVKDIAAPKTEAIWQSGIQKGDKIIKINGHDVKNSNMLIMIAQQSKAFDSKVDENFANQNFIELKKINPAFTKDEIIPKDILIKLPAKETEPAIIMNDNVLKGLEKYKDLQVSLTDTQKSLREKVQNKSYIISDGTITLNDVAYAISDNVHPVNLEVLRNGQTVALKPIYPNKNGIMGIQMEIKEIVIPTKTPKAVIKTSFNYVNEQTSLLLWGFYQMVTGKVSFSDIHGVIAITKVGGDVIHNGGMFYGLLLTAIISIDLFILNLLPIPPLDGGHLLFLGIEKLRGKPVEKEVIEKLWITCFAILLLFFVAVTANDIYALVTHKL